MQKGAFVQTKKGNVFTAIVIVLFIVTMIGMSGVLYWEKEKVLQSFVAEVEKTQNLMLELKGKKHEIERENSKKEQEINVLKAKIEELQIEKKEGEETNSKILELKQFVSDKIDGLDNSSKSGVGKIDILSQKMDKQISLLSSVQGLLFRSKGEKKKGRNEIVLPSVVVKEKASKTGKRKTKKEETKVKKLRDVQVMSVNKEHNFVVVNKGMVDGIEIGTRFTVFQNKKVIATIKIAEIRDFVSLGNIQDIQSGFEIKGGDTLAKTER